MVLQCTRSTLLVLWSRLILDVAAGIAEFVDGAQDVRDFYNCPGALHIYMI